MKFDLKLDAAQLKGLLSKLNILKIYSVFILPSILAGAALFLLLIPTPLLSSRLRNKINRLSITMGNQISSVHSAQISRGKIDIETEYQNLYANDANAIAALAGQTTLRELLSYQLFPEPNETSVLIFHDFANRYCDSLEQLVSRVSGREKPSMAEIERNLKKSGSDASNLNISSSSTFIAEQSSGVSFDRLSDIEKTIIDELCRSAAQSGSVYVNISELPGYNYWDIKDKTDIDFNKYQYQNAKQSVAECWYAQLSYWIIEDVFNTISAMNSNCRSVLDCPVKRLVSIDFGRAGSAEGASKSAYRPPRYVESPQEYMIMPFTKRVSDEKIDVIHFRLSVLVSADAVMPFMNELCSAKEHIFKGWNGTQPPKKFKHNQITILFSKAEPISLDSAEHQFYRYGDNVIFSLDLTCEYIFDKTAYEKVKPQFLKEYTAK